jgi:hypothetical protein
MNKNTLTDPDATLPILGTSNVKIKAWTMHPPGAHSYSLSFNIPVDFVNTSSHVILHFVTQFNIIPLIGDVDIQLNAIFVDPRNTISSVNLPISKIVLGVTSPAMMETYIHYEARFALNQQINPNDFAFLTFSRNLGDTYNDNLYLTSVEFRYATM